MPWTLIILIVFNNIIWINIFNYWTLFALYINFFGLKEEWLIMNIKFFDPHPVSSFAKGILNWWTDRPFLHLAEQMRK